MEAKKYTIVYFLEEIHGVKSRNIGFPANYEDSILNSTACKAPIKIKK